MKTLFQKEMNEKERTLYNEAIDYIKSKNQSLLNELDDVILNYKRNSFESRFYLDDLSQEEKIEYLKELREKLLKMNDCDKVKIKVAQPLHPMCWCYHLQNFFTNENYKKFCEDRIMYGFCVPFYPNKPIMIAHYVFEKGFAEVKDILVHELTHSLMNTKDLNATNSKDAINDAWTICFLY